MVACTTRGPEFCFISMPEDRYVDVVESAADEAITGPGWATLLPEALDDSAGESLDGLVCGLAEISLRAVRPHRARGGPAAGPDCISAPDDVRELVGDG